LGKEEEEGVGAFDLDEDLVEAHVEAAVVVCRVYEQGLAGVVHVSVTEVVVADLEALVV